MSEFSILSPKMQKLSKYLPSMKLDDYSFELHQECVDKWDSWITKASDAIIILKSELLSVVSECVDKWKGG